MPMPIKRHTWYILIINLEIKHRCREIPHLLLDVQLNLNSWIQSMILKISLSLSINRIMDHYCPKVPTGEVCFTLIYGGLWLCTNCRPPLLIYQNPPFDYKYIQFIYKIHTHGSSIPMLPGQCMIPFWESMIMTYIPYMSSNYLYWSLADKAPLDRHNRTYIENRYTHSWIDIIHSI